MKSTSSVIETGSPEDRTVTGFRARHGMSKSGYYRLPKKIRAALETVYGPRTIRITKKAEADFDRRHARPTGTEARLIQKLQDKRIAQARKAATASLAGPNHVSKQQRKRRRASVVT